MRRRATAAALLAAALGLGCHAREDAFFSRVFPCTPGDSCGTDRAGDPMMCYDTQQLGPHDFCVETCDPQHDPEDYGGYACLASGARLRECHPSEGSAACPSGLSCLRTDLFLDFGVCMDLPICATDADCVGAGTHTSCAGPMLASYYAGFKTDHLFCLLAGCQAMGSNCPAGESCLREVTKTVGAAPDICVPNCDPKGHCPPSFVCARQVYSKLSPAACVPGVPGYRCQRSLDCLVGACADTGAGFKQCTFPCAQDSDCSIFKTPGNYYACVAPAAGAPKHCLLLNDFSGSACRTDADCELAGQKCFAYYPYQPNETGQCRYPCAKDQTCQPRGGVAHVCLAGGAGGCYPGRFGLPCTADDQCTTGFRCLSPGAATDGGGAVAQSQGICTIPCTLASECAANPWTADDTACYDGICHLVLGGGAPCQDDRGCISHTCAPAGDGGAIRVCVAAP